MLLENLDFSHLSLHEAKKEEMESQVRTLELEADLMRERARFAALRKQHYHLASLVASESETQVNWLGLVISVMFEEVGLHSVIIDILLGIIFFANNSYSQK